MTLSRCDQRVTNALVTRTSHHPVPTRPDPYLSLVESSLHGMPLADGGESVAKPVSDRRSADACESDDLALAIHEREAR